MPTARLRTTNKSSVSALLNGPVGRHRIFLGLLLTLAVISIRVNELAIFAAFLTLVAWLSLPVTPSRTRYLWHIVLLAIAVLCLFGMTRFVRVHALAGMLVASKANLDKGTVSRLREILFAQDRARTQALVDPDADRIGGALFLSDLAGNTPPRGSSEPTPLLDRKYRNMQETKLGWASSINGYLFIVCLPTANGFTAGAHTRVDEQRAERRFIAYAWPLSRAASDGKVFSIDEHERIAEFINHGLQGLVYVGTENPPPCDAAIRPGRRFVPWKGKKPRQHLPGASPT